MAKCETCGERELVWERDTKGWKLYTMGGRLHQCRKTLTPTTAFKKLLEKK